MGKTSTKFKHWGKDERLSSKNNASGSSSNTASEQENENHTGNGDKLLWNYVAFQPSDDPKHSNGAKATTLRSRPLRSSQNSSKYYRYSKRRGSTSSSDSDDGGVKRVRRTPNSSRRITLPLLRKYIYINQ